jgi:hypothetical protein
MLASLIYVHIIPTNFIFDPIDVCFLGTIICTKVSSACIFPRVIFTFPMISCLMNPFFLFVVLHSTAGARYHSEILLSLDTVPRDDDFPNTADVHTLPLLPANEFCSQVKSAPGTDFEGDSPT